MWDAFAGAVRIIWPTIDRAIHSRRWAPFWRLVFLACLVVAAFCVLRGR